MSRIPDKIIDLRGTPCPTNYVKAKLYLEMMPLGSCLEVLVDDGEPRTHVPLSLEKDGQTILSIRALDHGVSILIEKRVD